MSQLAFWILSADGGLAKRWETLLTREGWQVAVERDLRAFAAGSGPGAPSARYGIALIDWELGRDATPELVRKVKAKSSGVAVILVSGPDLAPDKVIETLEAGADDHFPRNIDDRLFSAKVKSHLRRLLPSLASALDVLRSPGGEIKLDRAKHEAWIKGAKSRWATVPGLTRTEFQFLSLFLERPGRVLERQFIIESVWKDQGGEIQPGTVDKHVESLRRKLGRYGEMLRTVYGVGYALREEN